MELKIGDRVRTKSGNEGTIVMISRQTAFVELVAGKDDTVVGHLISELTKLEDSDPLKDQNSGNAQ